MAKLDKGERELLGSFEEGDWRPVEHAEREKARYRDVARATLRKDRRINIRISSQDLEELQKLAIRDGLPYQTLISSILHRYAAGRLRDSGD
jgi:predicted DNA binding CopG/RHH family protein